MEKERQKIFKQKFAWMDEWEDKDDIDWAKFDRKVLYEDDPNSKNFNKVINAIAKVEIKGKEKWRVYYCSKEKSTMKDDEAVAPNLGFDTAVFDWQKLLLCHEISSDYYMALKEAKYNEPVIAIGARMCKISNPGTLMKKFSISIPPFGMYNIFFVSMDGNN